MKTLGKGITVLFAGWNLVCASGCASLISGTHQTLAINAQPPGSEVTLYRWNGEVVAGPIQAPRPRAFTDRLGIVPFSTAHQ